MTTATKRKPARKSVLGRQKATKAAPALRPGSSVVEDGVSASDERPSAGEFGRTDQR